MRFNNSTWLLMGLLTCVLLVILWRRYDVRQATALAQFVAAHLRSRLTGSVSRLRRLLQRALFAGSILCLSAALAGPLIGYHWEKISRRGNEVVFALDTSRSMLTPDVIPTRLTRAKLAIDDMARQLDGDGIGIVAFAGSAFLVCPLTLDYGAFHQSLDAIDEHTIPRGGTNISSAIVAARAALRRHPGSDKILILVTDGENLEGDPLSAAQDAAKQEGLKIYTVGIGTAEGDLIPLPMDQGGGFVQDENGTLVKSHLDEPGLKAIASATGGAYVHLGGRGDDFDAFLASVFGAVTKHDLVYRQQKIYNERYQWPLAASLVMLLASLLVGTRRANRRGTAAVQQAIAATAAIGLLVVSPRSGSADQTAAVSGNSDSKAPVADYNAGTSAYRAGQFPQATQAFQKSIKAAPASDAKRLADQQDAYYNLGNSLYRAGQQVEKSAPQEAIAKWTEAVKAYDTALQLRADDADSKYNRDLVKRKIDALRQPPHSGGGGGGGGAGGGDGAGGQGSGQGQGQPPPQGQPPKGPPPQGQPPPPPQGQPPPQSQPPHAPAQNTTGAAPASAPPPAQDQPSPVQAAPSPAAGAAQGSVGNARVPGQMSADEARDLLDSAKSDEHHALAVPQGPRDPGEPEKVLKNW